MCPKSGSGAEPRLSPPQSGFKVFPEENCNSANQKSLTAAHLGGQSANAQNTAVPTPSGERRWLSPEEGSAPYLMETTSHVQAS